MKKAKGFLYWQENSSNGNLQVSMLSMLKRSGKKNGKLIYVSSVTIRCINDAQELKSYFVCRKYSGFTSITEADEEVTTDYDVMEKVAKLYVVPRGCFQLWRKSARSYYCKNKIWMEKV